MDDRFHRQPMPFYDDRFNHHHGHPIVPWLVLAVLLALLVVLTVIAIRWLLQDRRGGAAPEPQPGAAPPVDDAVVVLRMRYARGEVARDDFVRMSADLGVAVPQSADWPGPPPAEPLQPAAT